MNFAKLNHILIPATKDERDRLRASKKTALFRAAFWFFELFSYEGRALMILWFLVSAFALNVESTQYYFLWAAMTAALIVSVGARGFVGLTDVDVLVRAPRRIAVGDEMTFLVELSNRGFRTHEAIRIEGPFLPWDGAYSGTAPSVAALEPRHQANRQIKARFVARGEHHLDPFRARALAPLGLAAGPAVESKGPRFLVVPRIANVARIDLDLGARYQPGGVALASSLGESRDLVGVRPYRPGDPLRDLHARTWARVGHPVVRQYQQEYFTRIAVVLDTAGGIQDHPIFEAAVSLAAGITAHLSRTEALIDLLVLGDELHSVHVGRSLGSLDQALDLLACARPKTTSKGPGLLERLEPHLPLLSSLVFIAVEWDPRRDELLRQSACHRVAVKAIQVMGKPRRSKDPLPGGVTLIGVDAVHNRREIAL